MPLGRPRRPQPPPTAKRGGWNPGTTGPPGPRTEPGFPKSRKVAPGAGRSQEANPYDQAKLIRFCITINEFSI